MERVRVMDHRRYHPDVVPWNESLYPYPQPVVPWPRRKPNPLVPQQPRDTSNELEELRERLERLEEALRNRDTLPTDDATAKKRAKIQALADKLGIKIRFEN